MFIDRSNAWTPRYHFFSQEEKNMPFDPNGLIFWKGRYHVFYLFGDKSINPRGCGWEHASSADLVHWDFHKPALICDHPDERSMNSGNALVTKDGKVALVYNSCDVGMCIAIAQDDNLENWAKIPENPVIPTVKPEYPEFQVVALGDPYCWIENGHYYAAIGSRARPYSEYDTAYLYRSDDMIHWEYLRPLYQATDHYSMRLDDCECPELFDFGKQRMLLHITHARGARCYLGDWIMDTFVPHYCQFFNFPGGNVFAPRSMVDGNGRRLVWFWLDDRLRYREDASRPDMRQIWALPRVFEPIEGGNGLRQSVPKEIQDLCSESRLTLTAIPELGAPVASPFRSRSCKLHVALKLAQGRFSMDLFSNKDGSESLRLTVDKEAGRLVLDHSTAKYPLPNNTYFWVPEATNPQSLRQEIPWKADENGNYEFDIYLDNCVAEFFDTRGQFAATQCIYTSSENDCILLRAEPNSRLDHLMATFHDMMPLVLNFTR